MDDKWGGNRFFSPIYGKLYVKMLKMQISVCSKATNTFFNSGVMMMILVNVVVGTSKKPLGVGRTGAFSHGKVGKSDVSLVSGWCLVGFSHGFLQQPRLISQEVLAMDRYPEHLVEASVGDVPQLSEITPEIKRLRR